MAQNPQHYPGDLMAWMSWMQSLLGLFCSQMNGLSVAWQVLLIGDFVERFQDSFLGGLFMGQRDETLMLPVTGSLKVGVFSLRFRQFEQYQ